MTTINPAFVVVDIPEPARSEIQLIRIQLNSIAAKLPVEITLAGSSGVGPIPIGTDLRLITEVIDDVASACSPFYLEFSKIDRFPTTGVFYLAPKDRTMFDDLHRPIKGSNIPFSESRFPYNPHCTLRNGPPVDESKEREIFATKFPQSAVLIDSLSVYELDGKTLGFTLLHRSKMKNAES